MSELTSVIRSKGYWRVEVRPAQFVRNGIPRSDLSSILQRAVVRLRGWDFPHVEGQAADRRGNDWIGGETDRFDHREAWRFYQSGQFVHLRALPEDWMEPDRFMPFSRVPRDIPGLGVGDALFRITEVFEFASRLSVTEAGSDQMVVGIELRNTAGRHLYVDDPRRMSMDNQYSFHDKTLTTSVVTSRGDITGRSRDLALDTASDVFGRFGWYPDRGLLRGQQDELRW